MSQSIRDQIPSLFPPTSAQELNDEFNDRRSAFDGGQKAAISKLVPLLDNLLSDVMRLEKVLKTICQIDPENLGLSNDEWGEAECFHRAKKMALDAVLKDISQSNEKKEKPAPQNNMVTLDVQRLRNLTTGK